jgi:hypothetical protein
MKKLGILLGITALVLSISPAFAAGKSAPKATGGYGYTIYGVARHAEFNAIQTATCTKGFDVNGANTILVPWVGTYTYTVNFILTGTTLTGTLNDSYYPTGDQPLSGNVTGNAITFTYDYPSGSPQGTRTYTGTIDSTGQITGGEWSDSADLASGTWTVGTPFAQVIGGCTGKGMFHYSDVNGTDYKVDVRYVDVLGNTAWFAGPIVSGNFGDPSQWLFVKAVDNGEPGTTDVTAGDYPLNETLAKYNVANHVDPSISTVITSGNIQVH